MATAVQTLRTVVSREHTSNGDIVTVSKQVRNDRVFKISNLRMGMSLQISVSCVRPKFMTTAYY
jgi:hypothetical protein